MQSAAIVIGLISTSFWMHQWENNNYHLNMGNHNHSLNLRTHRSQQIAAGSLLNLSERTWGNVQRSGKIWGANMFASEKTQTKPTTTKTDHTKARVGRRGKASGFYLFVSWLAPHKMLGHNTINTAQKHECWQWRWPRRLHQRLYKDSWSRVAFVWKVGKCCTLTFSEFF